MKRRAFLGSLLAPLVAPFVPEPSLIPTTLGAAPFWAYGPCVIPVTDELCGDICVAPPWRDFVSPIVYIEPTIVPERMRVRFDPKRLPE